MGQLIICQVGWLQLNLKKREKEWNKCVIRGPETMQLKHKHYVRLREENNDVGRAHQASKH